MEFEFVSGCDRTWITRSDMHPCRGLAVRKHLAPGILAPLMIVICAADCQCLCSWECSLSVSPRCWPLGGKAGAFPAAIG